MQFPRVDDLELTSSLEELGRLVSTLGYQVVAQVTQVRAHIEASAVIGEGKLQELAAITGGSGNAAATVQRKKTKVQIKREAEEAGDDDEVEDDEDDEDRPRPRRSRRGRSRHLTEPGA